MFSGFFGGHGVFNYIAERQEVALDPEELRVALDGLDNIETVQVSLRKILNHSNCLERLNSEMQDRVRFALLEAHVELNVQNLEITAALKNNLINLIMTSSPELKLSLSMVSIYKNTFLNKIFMTPRGGLRPSMTNGSLRRLISKVEENLHDGMEVKVLPVVLALTVDKDTEDLSRFPDFKNILSVDWSVFKQKLP